MRALGLGEEYVSRQLAVDRAREPASTHLRRGARGRILGFVASSAVALTGSPAGHLARRGSPAFPTAHTTRPTTGVDVVFTRP